MLMYASTGVFLFEKRRITDSEGTTQLNSLPEGIRGSCVVKLIALLSLG